MFRKCTKDSVITQGSNWSAVISIFCLSAVSPRSPKSLGLRPLQHIPFFSFWPWSSLHFLLIVALQVSLLKEQKRRFGGVQHIHRETPVHREGPSLRPASIKLYLVSAAGSGWVRRAVYLTDQSTAAFIWIFTRSSPTKTRLILFFVCAEAFGGLGV